MKQKNLNDLKTNPKYKNYKPEPEKDKYIDIDLVKSGKNGIVRNKKDREVLNGYKCEICEEFYQDLGEEDNQEIKNLCSRHRCLENPNKTPKQFYDIDI